MDSTIEIWKWIRGFEELYEASNLGNIRNYKTGKILSKSVDNCGYVVNVLYSKGTKKTFKSHRLIAGAWIPTSNNLLQINHINGIKTDNRVENLEWCTQSENMKHAYKNNLQIPRTGINHHGSKLNNYKVKEIRKLYKTGDFSARELGNKYGVKKTTIQALLENRTWKQT